MPDPIAEYTVRDYSAVDEQVKQIAERERVLTQKLKLANLRRLLILGVAALLAFGLFLILAAWAYRIAFPPEPTIIETVKVVEKVIQPPKIVIETPDGSRVSQVTGRIQDEATNATNPSGSVIKGSEADRAIEDTENRLSEQGVTNTGSSAAVSLLWNNRNDLDLLVQEPNGSLIFFKQKRSGTNGQLDVDANFGRVKTNSPIENIKWPDGRAPKGEYQVFVLFYAKDGSEPMSGETPYKVVMSYGGSKNVYAGKFTNSTASQTRNYVGKFIVE